MSHLTLQEVIDRINRIYFLTQDLRIADRIAKARADRPEFYIPRITRHLAKLMFGTYSS